MDERKSFTPVEFKLTGDTGTFRATFSRMSVIDRDGDVTEPGAFKDGQEVRIAQWGHNWGVPVIGKGTIHADDTTAWVDGQFFLDTAAGNDTYKTVKNLGSLQEWSYGFQILEATYGQFEGRDVRFLKGLDVFEVSPVMIGAGIGTGTDAIKSAGDALAVESDKALAATSAVTERLKSLADIRAKVGRALSQANRDRLAQHRDAMTTIATDIGALLAETEPTDGKALDTSAVLMETELIIARLNGVAV